MRTTDLVDLMAGNAMATRGGEEEQSAATGATHLPPLLQSLLQDGMEVCSAVAWRCVVRWQGGV